MNNVYSHQFCSSHGGTSTSYAVPAGYVAIVRCITAVNRDTAAQGFNIAVAPAGLLLYTAEVPLVAAGPPSNTSLIAELRAVVNSGSTISIGITGYLDITVSGYLLSLP